MLSEGISEYGLDTSVEFGNVVTPDSKGAGQFMLVPLSLGILFCNLVCRHRIDSASDLDRAHHIKHNQMCTLEALGGETMVELFGKSLGVCLDFFERHGKTVCNKRA